jgi:hypothetical protein
MTKDDIIRMAKEARFYIEDNEANIPFNQEDFNITEHLKNDLTEHLERFAKLVTEHERPWIGLTNDELTDLFYNENLGQQSAVGQAIALLRERNEKAD